MKEIKDQIKRWNRQILCVLVGFLFFGLAMWQEKGDLLSQGYVERNGYGEDKKTYELMVEGIEDQRVECVVEIEPLRYTQEEAQAVFEELIRQIPDEILGENPSLDQVSTDLNLVTLFDGTGVRAVWQSHNPKILDSYGRISEEEIPPEGEEVILEVVLTDGIYSRKETFSLCIVLPLKDDGEQLAAQIAGQIRRLDMEHPYDRQVRLPEEYEGYPLRYRNGEDGDYWILPVLGILMAVLFYGQEKAKKEREQKRRQRMLLLDYADVVYQLMVYTGAGLTVGKAWEQIVENYKGQQGKQTGFSRPVYEEMALTLNQIRCGTPEGAAIGEFGRRCKLQCYMKLSSLLEQNRKTGTKNLNQLLEQEMTAAWEEQKHTARRMGEEAKTRLLAPLFLMLLVVMVIIMVPARMVMTN